MQTRQDGIRFHRKSQHQSLCLPIATSVRKECPPVAIANLLLENGVCHAAKTTPKRQKIQSFVLLLAKPVDAVTQNATKKWAEGIACDGNKQMEFDGKFLQYQSNNILYMDLGLTLSQARNKCLKEEHNHASGEQIIKKIQLQNQDRKSCAASINQNIENGNKQQANQAQNGLQVSEKVENHAFLKMVFTGVTLFQFSILFSLIILQYISSKIELSTLVTIATIDVAIHVLLIGLAQTIANQEHFKNHQVIVQREQEDRQPKDKEQLKTLPKINQQMCKRSNAKTKKIPFANNRNAEEEKNTEQTIKKETLQDKRQELKKESEEKQGHSIEGYRTCIVILKIIQAVLLIVMSTLCLAVLTAEEGRERQAIIVLSIAAYLLATCSIGIFWQLFNKIFSHSRVITQRMAQKQQKQGKVENQHNPKTVISIDQAIEAKASDSNKVLQAQHQVGQQSHLQKEQENSVSEKQKEEKQKEQELCKIQIKKSVLKTNKKARIEQHEELEENIQRRKVGINSKKIEYFQYSVISPSHSVVDDSEIKKSPSVKSKYGLQKMAHIKQRMDKEEMILKNKLMARQAKAKSLGRIGRETIKKQEEKIEDSFMADYFS